MGRVYGEPIEVQANADGRPVRFVWRGRRYTVRAVIEHWVVNREWWRDPDPDAATGRPASMGRPALGDGLAGAPGAPGDSPVGPGGSPVPGQPGVLYWRVEAAVGQSMPSGPYELSEDMSTGAWTMRRVAD